MDDKLKERLNNQHQKGVAIQEIARQNNVSVEDVLTAIGEQELLHVQFTGDQIDDAGPGATINYGKVFKVPYTKD